jgi:hypothetical protein
MPTSQKSLEKMDVETSQELRESQILFREDYLSLLREHRENLQAMRELQNRILVRKLLVILNDAKKVLKTHDKASPFYGDYMQDLSGTFINLRGVRNAQSHFINTTNVKRGGMTNEGIEIEATESSRSVQTKMRFIYDKLTERSVTSSVRSLVTACVRNMDPNRSVSSEHLVDFVIRAIRSTPEYSEVELTDEEQKELNQLWEILGILA